MLDLTYVTTGQWQHVSATAGDPSDVWVYKIPAAFGYIVGTRPPAKIFWAPANFFQTALGLALVVLPSRIYDGVHGLATRVEKRRLFKLASALKPLTHLSHLIRAGAFRSLAANCKPMRRRRFRRMVELLEYLVKHGLGRVVLPFQAIGDVRADLRIDSRVLDYRGPLLLQRKADHLFEGGESVKGFDWKEFVDSEQALWREGIGFGNAREALGPWGLLDGHVRLFDTSGLTRNHRAVWRCLNKERLDRREKVALRKITSSATADAEEYFRFVRKEINQEKLDRLWKIDVAAKARGVSSSEATSGESVK